MPHSFSLYARALGGTLIAALLALAPLAARADGPLPPTTCIDIEKKVSVDGGVTFVDADEAADAPEANTATGALYRIVLENCGSVALDGVIEDQTLAISQAIQTLPPGVTRVYSAAKPGFENLDQPGVCDPGDGEIRNKALVRAQPADPNDGTSEIIDFDFAWVRCVSGPICGDGMVDPGEDCDDGNVDDFDGCRNDCTIPVCGDGRTDPGEACDDGNADDLDGCRNDCSLPICGDGITDPGEDCDDGNAIDDDACPNDCTFAVCGDGIVEGGEACDDGNADDDDGCRSDCSVPICGDGITDPDLGEQCDDGNTNDLDDCRNDCTAPICGDGIQDAGEQCDDGNADDFDGCRNDCTSPVCGDGFVDAGEQCDDGNADNFDDCRNDCTAPFCGDGFVDPGEQCDDGNGTSGDGCSADCEVEAPCVVDVEKTCEVVPMMPATSSNCDGKVVSMRLEYTGLGCSATSNPQEGKATCEGGADGAEPVSIVVSDKDGNDVWGSDASVSIGDIVLVEAANAGEDDLDSETFVHIDGDLETLNIHTSCSKPLAVGDRFGSVRVVELTTTDGGTTTLPGDDGGSTACSVRVDPVGTECEDRPAMLGLRYVGGDCSQTTQDQEGRVACSGNASTVAPVRIVASEDEDGGGDLFLDESGVELGQVVTVLASTGGRDELRSNTSFSIRDAAGNELQALTIHTSCSKRLALGDRFGALEVVSFTSEDGASASLGGLVDFAYRVTNAGALAATVDVTDSELGTVASGLVVESGGEAVVTVQSLVGASSMSTASVVGGDLGGAVCEATSDVVTLTVEEPPVRGVSCEDGKPVRLVFEYLGGSCADSDNTQDDKFDCSGDVGMEAVSVTSSHGDVVASPSSLAIGDLLTVTKPDGGKLRSETELSLAGAGGVQDLNIHTSCSAPLAVGDRFGSLLLVDFVPEP